MTDAQLAVIGSLVGVLFGVVGTLLTTFVQQRAENRRTSQRASEDRRKEDAQLVAEFSAVEMRAWKRSEIIHMWSKANMDVLASPKESSLEERLTAASSLTQDLYEQYALIRILLPSLADAAGELVETRLLLFAEDDISALWAAHEAARGKFEEQARTLLNGHPLSSQTGVRGAAIGP
jgi:hypothetical protein